MGAPTFDAEATPEIGRGDRGEWVDFLQGWLAHEGFPLDPPSGTFDDATETAVRTFQQRSRVPETGRADRATWHVIATGGPPAAEDAPASGPVPTARDDGPLTTTLEPTHEHGYHHSSASGTPITAAVVPQSTAPDGWVTLDIDIENKSHWTLDPVTYSWVASIRDTTTFVGEGSGTIGRMEALASTSIQASHHVETPQLGDEPPIYQFIVMVFCTDTEYHLNSHDEVRAYYSVSSDLTVAAERA